MKFSVVDFETQFWTFSSYGNGLISTLRITSGILKRQRPPLSAMVGVTGNGQFLAPENCVTRFTLFRILDKVCRILNTHNGVVPYSLNLITLIKTVLSSNV